MLFSTNFSEKLLAWIIAAACAALIVFMVFFNELTRGLLALWGFFYLFGAFVWHVRGETPRYTMVYEMVNYLARWLWKGDHP
ncbi:hypothetical protein REMIM1_PC00167 (plasmid) [Rhizobium etli bv. mimosae str. Mim1]|nr:hypothetical protein REMIM1_PC00167 [Rhizobium etli bv. mimosae str. Mim1]